MHKGPEFNPQSCQSGSRQNAPMQRIASGSRRRGWVGGSERPCLDRDVLVVDVLGRLTGCGLGTTKLPSGKPPGLGLVTLCPHHRSERFLNLCSKEQNELSCEMEYLHLFTRKSHSEEFVMERIDLDNWQSCSESCPESSAC